jgi:hypothetical protein
MRLKLGIDLVLFADMGERGLAHFDRLVKIAEEKGVKLIVALTNNWADCALAFN